MIHSDLESRLTIRIKKVGMKRLILLCLVLVVALGVGIYLNRPMPETDIASSQTNDSYAAHDDTQHKTDQPSTEPAISSERESNQASNPTEDSQNTLSADSTNTDQADSSTTETTPLEAEYNETQRALAKQLDVALKRNASIPLEATQAQHFVSDDQLIILPDADQVNLALLEEWVPSQAATQEAPVTSSAQSDSTPTQAGITTSDEPVDATSFGVGEGALTPFTPQSVQRDVVTEGNTIPSLIDSSSPAATTTQEAQSALATPKASTPARTVRLKELLDEPESDEKRVFYLHSVNQGDDQGLWGIVQTGLTSRFAKGIVLDDRSEPISALIPREADERLADKTSSFLGKRLHQKVATTYVFNYQKGVIGKNPNTIHPGQQLIIVAFTESELLDIYQAFAHQDPSGGQP